MQGCHLLPLLDVVRQTDCVSLKRRSHAATGTITFYVFCARFQADVLEGPIHAVLGGPEPDVDTVAATLCLALHLSQVTWILSAYVNALSMCFLLKTLLNNC